MMKTTALLTVVWSLIPFALGFPKPQSDLRGLPHADNGAESVKISSDVNADRNSHNILPRDKNETQPVHPSPAYEVTCGREKQQINKKAFDDKCPGAGEGDDETVADGLWYEPSWLKGYCRGNCTTGLVCQGNQRGIACRNEGEGTWIKGAREE